MNRRLKDRAANDDRGFTLVELMVVVVIIAILAGIAIPTFLNTRKRSQDQAAKSNLRNALSVAQSLYADTQDYSAVTATELGDEEPSLEFVATASTGPKVISVSSSDTAVVLAAKSASGECWMMRHTVDPASADAGTQQAKGSCDAASTTGVTFEDL